MLVVIVIIVFGNQHYIPRTSGIVPQLFSNVIKDLFLFSLKVALEVAITDGLLLSQSTLKSFGFWAEKHPLKHRIKSVLKMQL